VRGYDAQMLSASEHVLVRSAREDDASRLANVFAASWQHTYCGIIPPAHLSGMTRRRNTTWWLRAIDAREDVLVLVVTGTVAGYATYGKSRAAGPYKGEIYELYLDPIHQGLGFGELLFEACRARLDQRRLPGLIVWALSANEAATSFYWRRGGRPIARTLDRIGGAKLEKIAFTWE